MSMETLNSSVGSLVEETLFAEMDDEELLLRRLSPYATLRSGDLAALMGIQRQNRGLQHLKAASLFADPIAERSDSDSESEKDVQQPEGRDVVVRGQDIGDLPAEYVVRGLLPHEMPVIGSNLVSKSNVYVDQRILPGFRYSVRHAGTQRRLFGGKATALQSVGLGYGKRITFAGESVNFNENYFWSDSHPNGFAFSIEAVAVGDALTIYGGDGGGVIGEVKVEKIYGPQEEISSEVVNGDVVKRVKVTMQCSVSYQHHSHGMVDFKICRLETLTGEAQVIKKRGTRVAKLDSIHRVQLSVVDDLCTLQVES